MLDPTEDRYSVLARCVRGAVGQKKVIGLESLQHFFDVAGHGDRDGARGEGDIHAKVCIACFLNRQLVTVALESLDEVLSIVTGTVLDPEVVHNEAELDVMSEVTEETWSVGRLNVTVFA